MTGWRKRQIADQVDAYELTAQRVDLARECIELRTLLNDSRYFTLHYGMTTATESEKSARALHLAAVHKVLGLDVIHPPRPLLPIDN
jgi:hypothetical protein